MVKKWKRGRPLLPKVLSLRNPLPAHSWSPWFGGDVELMLLPGGASLRDQAGFLRKSYSSWNGERHSGNSQSKLNLEKCKLCWRVCVGRGGNAVQLYGLFTWGVASYTRSGGVGTQSSSGELQAFAECGWLKQDLIKPEWKGKSMNLIAILQIAVTELMVWPRIPCTAETPILGWWRTLRRQVSPLRTHVPL